MCVGLHRLLGWVGLHIGEMTMSFGSSSPAPDKGWNHDPGELGDMLRYVIEAVKLLLRSKVEKTRTTCLARLTGTTVELRSVRNAPIIRWHT